MSIEIGKLVINLNLKGSADEYKSATVKASAIKNKIDIKEMVNERAEEILDVLRKKNER